MMRSRSEVGAKTRRRGCRGFSTIEVLAGSGLTLIMMGTTVNFSQAQLKALATQRSYAQSQSATRTGGVYPRDPLQPSRIGGRDFTTD